MAENINKNAETEAASSILEIRSLQKAFGGHVVLKDISLSVERGNVISIIGPSGSGKSTLLRCASFLETADGGDILYDGKYAMHDGAYASKAELNRFRTRFGLVFQNFNLFPHYSVLRNVAEPSIIHGENKEAAQARAMELLKKMGLDGKENAYPFQLSGGQQQRVAIARALVTEPTIICMDEPLSNLDAKLRNQMRAEIIKLRQRINTTFIYVTHDQTEAMTLGDRIVIMKRGFIQR